MNSRAEGARVELFQYPLCTTTASDDENFKLLLS